MSDSSARSGQPLGACAPTSLAKMPQELVLSMPMEKHLVCSKREDWRVSVGQEYLENTCYAF